MESMNDYLLMGFQLDPRLKNSCGKTLQQMKRAREKKDGVKSFEIQCVRCRESLARRDAVIIPWRKYRDYVCMKCYEILKCKKNGICIRKAG